MKPLACSLAALAGFAAGWSAVRWIGPSDTVRENARLLVKQESVSAGAATAAINQGTTARERMDAIAAIFQQPSGPARDRALAAAVMKLEAADFPAGAEAMLVLLQRPRQGFLDESLSEFAEAWMDRWLEIDSPGALRFLGSATFLGQIPGDANTGWRRFDLRAGTGLGGIFHALARRQPEWTRDYVAKMAAGGRREVALYALAQQVAQDDPAKARSFLPGFAETKDHPTALTGFITGLASVDVRASFDAAWAEAPGDLRDDLLRQVFGFAGRRSADSVRELLERLDDPATRAKLAAEALSQLGFEGREDALPFIKEESERMAGAGGWKGTASDDWASSVDVAARGPQARNFAEWAASFAPDAYRKMLRSVAEVWAGRAPTEFRDWLLDHAGTLDAAAAKSLEDALGNLTRHDPALARTLAEKLPPGALRDQARFQAALGLSAEDGLAEAAAAYRAMRRARWPAGSCWNLRRRMARARRPGRWRCPPARRALRRSAR